MSSNNPSNSKQEEASTNELSLLESVAKLCMHAMDSCRDTEEDHDILLHQLQGKKTLLRAYMDSIDNELHQLETKKQAKMMQKIMHDQDIWVSCILPFVGIGHFAFVAGVNRIFRDYYKQYLSSLQKLPRVSDFIYADTRYIENSLPEFYKKFSNSLGKPVKKEELWSNGDKVVEKTSCTFYSSAFATVSCAEYWESDTKGDQEQYNKVCSVAARNGNIEVLEWAHNRKFPWDAYISFIAAFNGDLAVLKWARVHGCPWDKTTTTAALNCRMDVLKWARKNGCPWDTTTSSAAAFHGNFNILKWAHENQCPWDPYTCSGAATNGHLEVLKYAHENGCPWDEKTCSEAATNGHLQVLKWAHENGCPWNWTTCAVAAENGHLEILKWAHETGCPWDHWTCACAAKNGHLEVLKYAHENGCPWNKWTCAHAAGKGHLEVLKYAFEHGCPWNDRTCTYAAENGHLQVLKWAFEHGCPWNAQTFEKATRNGHLHVLKFAHENGCLSDKDACIEMAKVARQNGHFEVSSWLGSVLSQLRGY